MGQLPGKRPLGRGCGRGFGPFRKHVPLQCAHPFSPLYWLEFLKGKADCPPKAPGREGEETLPDFCFEPTLPQGLRPSYLPDFPTLVACRARHQPPGREQITSPQLCMDSDHRFTWRALRRGRSVILQMRIRGPLELVAGTPGEGVLSMTQWPLCFSSQRWNHFLHPLYLSGLPPQAPSPP